MLLFRQLFEPVSSTYTYLLADESAAGRPAVIVDPVDCAADRDAALVQQLGLTLIYAINTHVHADHVTGTGLLKKKIPGVRSVISEASGARADVKVRDGDEIQFGNLTLQVRATPGHTAGCVTYVLRGGESCHEPLRAFTVHSRILSLPPDTLLYPAHDYKGNTVTTVREELAYNPRLTKSEDDFKILMDDLGLPYPKMIDVAQPANMACGVQDGPVANGNGVHA
eukprot:jgi/Chlat1/8457/Chrsp80S07866